MMPLKLLAVLCLAIVCSCSVTTPPTSSKYPPGYVSPNLDEHMKTWPTEPKLLVEGSEIRYRINSQSGLMVLSTGDLLPPILWSDVLGPLLRSMPLEHRNQVLNAVLSHARTHDPFEKALRFYPKIDFSRNSRLGVRGIIYADGRVGAVLVITYRGRDWLFVERVKVLVGNELVLDAKVEFDRQVTGSGVKEEALININDPILSSFLDKFDNTEQDILVRVQGSGTYRDFTPSRSSRLQTIAMLQAIENIENIENTRAL